jgi:hypothetical protein
LPEVPSAMEQAPLCLKAVLPYVSLRCCIYFLP